MAPKKAKQPVRKVKAGAVIENAGVVIEQQITDTLEKNYMPYAMSVIVSRAIPEIDGFKPSHRKILYTMYKMGLLNGARTKSANVVGQTMRLNPHGDGAIYETLVRLSRGCEALLHPYVDSKGNFGKAFSRDMAYAASRYTEVKLDAICAELFRDIDKETVDFAPNYDNTMMEPVLLPTTFPSVLVNANVGIAVGMASSICSFNLSEVCETAVALIRNPNHRIADTLKAPDFPGGGFIVYNEDEIGKIYETGRGSVKVRARYNYDKSQNCIEITEIPPSTTVEAIMDKIVDHVKSGKIREVADMRDETDLSGLKLAIDLKRGVDPDKLMLKLFKTTPLEDNYSCNFNILIGGTPRVMGVREILTEWTAFRTDCVKRRVYYDLQKKSDKLHLLEGLSKILLDIDKAIGIIRKTEEESEVVPNLMIGFSIDEIQAEYVAEIKLRHLNRQYILKRTEEIGQLEKDIEEMRAILADDRKVRKLIIKELGEVSKKYGKPRRSLITFADEEEAASFEEELPDYPVNLFFSREGYFKKITPQSLRMSSEQKLKEGDEVSQHIESTNAVELLFFTDKCQVYKSRANDFDDTKASVLGEYVPAKLGMDSEEKAVFMAATKDYSGYMLFLYENGKLAKVDMQAYSTKTRRKKLLSAYSDKAGLAGVLHIPADCEVVLRTTGGRVLLLDTALVLAKSAKNTQGIAVLTLARGQQISDLHPLRPEEFENPGRYRAKSLPARGAMLSPKDVEEQTTLL